MEDEQKVFPESLRVTLILVARDEERYIAGAIGMACRQDFSATEYEILLIIDPATTDNTERLARQTLLRYDFPNARVLYAPRSSLAEGWNEGIRRATADCAVRWDVHGEYPDNYLSSCLAVMRESKEDIVGGPCANRLAPGSQNFWSRCIFAAEDSPMSRVSRFRRAGRPRYVATLARALYRRHVFVRSGLFRNLPFASQDDDCHARIRAQGIRFYFDPRIESWHYPRTSLRALDRQKWRNGAAVASLAVLNPRTFRPMLLIPMAWVSTLAILCLLAFVGSSLALVVGLTLLGIYATSVFGVAFMASSRVNLFEILGVAFVIARIHLIYGLGGWWGLLTVCRQIGIEHPTLGSMSETCNAEEVQVHA